MSNDASRSEGGKTFTGRASQHSARRSVKIADSVSTIVITVGGIGAIVAVSLVFVLLLSVVIPMFGEATVSSPESQPMAVVSGDATPETSTDNASSDVDTDATPDETPATESTHKEPIATGVDEYRVATWVLTPDGQLTVYRVDTGDILDQQALLPAGVTLNDASLLTTEQHIALARSDGKLQVGQIQFETTFLSKDDVPKEHHSLSEGDVMTLGRSVVQMTPQKQFRAQQLALNLTAPVDLEGGSLVRMNHTVTSSGTVVAAGLTEDSSLVRIQLRERMNFATGQKKLTATTTQLPLELPDGEAPHYIMVPSRGDGVYAIWKDGRLDRFDARSGEPVSLCETVELVGDRATEISQIAWVIGRETLLVADTNGRCRAWFPVRQSEAKTSDGSWFLPIHELPTRPVRITDLAISQRSRMVAVGYEDGHVQVVQVTTEVDMVERPLVSDGPVRNLMFAPKDNGLLAVTGQRIYRAEFHPAYPEATFKSLFQPVWYEGYERPEQVWQSSFAGVKSEMKLGLMPLIFGTVKATVYSMLFGVPIALLAAIYTSEFLSKRIRNKVKSLIEMMASLPSVVLGFIGGLVIAPVVEQFVPSTICSFVTIPICWMLGAYLWQQLPHRVGLLLAPYRLFFVLGMLTLGILLAWGFGPSAEGWFFAGDMALWLDQQKGTGTGAWLFLLLPLSALVTAGFVTLLVNPWLAEKTADWSRSRFAFLNLIKFVVGTVLAMLLAVGMAYLLSNVWDPRGGYVGTYVQRNALVVGIVMGFAIIPIIYTISEDSLSTVPAHLRSASLGAGATPLQTAVRVVIPTAMSGLFSAVMIGLGRAVGETMIVLMAAGNTALIDWNVFNGFRTLSANIAVELPEAVRDSTHYRTLFLAALTLLLLTFIINTVAELVRLRFRKRAIQL